MMRIIEIIYSIPRLLWVILLLVVMKPGIKPIIIAIAITGWGGMARVVRGQVLQLKQMEFVLAAKTLGADTGRILLKHLIPNTMGPIIINLTFQVPTAVFTEAFLSYLGLGIPAPAASWGSLAQAGTKMILLYPHMLLFPAALISIFMLAFNLLGDGLRDALDPRLRA
jgi:oligopeptide transport system permease protein